VITVSLWLSVTPTHSCGIVLHVWQSSERPRSVSFMFRCYCQLIWRSWRDRRQNVVNCHVAASLPSLWQTATLRLHCQLIVIEAWLPTYWEVCGVIAILLWQTATLRRDRQLNWMLRRDRWLIVANCHSHTLLWDLTAQSMKQGGTTLSLVYHRLIVANCHVAAPLPTYWLIVAYYHIPTPVGSFYSLNKAVRDQNL
jgi:hypothetical protein